LASDAEDVETVGVFELDPVALQQKIKAKKVIYSGVMSGVIATVTVWSLKFWMMQKKVQEAEEEAIAAKILYH
jgi:hypothetical protein